MATWPVRGQTRDQRGPRPRLWWQKGWRWLRLHLINATDSTRPFKVMPAAKIGVAAFEIPENAVRVLLTGYSVSPSACISFITRSLHLPDISRAHYHFNVSPPRGTHKTQLGSLSLR
jgi:hypothetical protein